jgi:hypothetical protein
MKDAFYFPHDSNAHNDEKILKLRLRCDWGGVGLYWTLIEILRDSPTYKYPHDLATLELGLSTPQATLEATLEACFELGLMIKKDGFFSSPALDRRMEEVDSKREILREAGRRGGIKSRQAQATLKPGLSHPQAVKERKVKERKVNITDAVIPEDLKNTEPEIREWLEYKQEKGQSYKPIGFRNLLESIRAIPAGRRAASIKNAMAKNWSGIFEIKDFKEDSLKQEASSWLVDSMPTKI